MEDTSGTPTGSVSSRPLDPGRKYGRQDETNKNNFYCNFCGVRTLGGVFRLKEHLAGGYRNTLRCKKVSEQYAFFTSSSSRFGAGVSNSKLKFSRSNMLSLLLVAA